MIFFTKSINSSPIEKPIFQIKNQPQEHKYAQEIPKSKSHPKCFNDKRKTLTDRTESYLFFQRNKKPSYQAVLRKPTTLF